MHLMVEAIYDDGVLRPLEKLSLRPQQRVLLRIDEAPDAAVEIEDQAFLTTANQCFKMPRKRSSLRDR